MTIGEINVLKLARNLFRTVQISPITMETYGSGFVRRKNLLIEIGKKKMEDFSRTEVARKMRVVKEYYKVEMSPPNINEGEKLKADLALFKEFMQTGCYKFITVRQAWLLFLISVEIGMWFFLGETIGKWHIVGYKV